LAAVTSRIRLGTLVSPATFRHPSNLLKVVATADQISDGRVELGLGAGWNEPEHKAYGFPFPPTRQRMDIFAEQIEIIHRSWNDPGPVDFNGEHYTLDGLVALPKPVHTPHPNLIVGGQGGPRSVAIAARWADEYNTNFANAAECARRKDRLARACEKRGRELLVFSLMTGCIVGTDGDDLGRRASKMMLQEGDPHEYLESLPDVYIWGTVQSVPEKLAVLAKAGVDRVMMQMQDHTDLEMVHVLGKIAELVA
jgi:alkanesulfonate monooxygenase SsuD/methylene tetrahydromethanopterin reductase-like flavin-dependent oxidoreductase (luciferase family)